MEKRQALPKVTAKVKHHKAMLWGNVPAFYADLKTRNAMAAKALIFTCLKGSRTGEVLGMRWGELDLDARLSTCPAERMKGGEDHRVPLTDEMLAVIEPLKAMKSEYVFEGQKRRKPLSNMAMLMLLRRMDVEGVTVHRFRSTFRDWAGEVANEPREVAEMSLFDVSIPSRVRHPCCYIAATFASAVIQSPFEPQNSNRVFTTNSRKP